MFDSERLLGHSGSRRPLTRRDFLRLTSGSAAIDRGDPLSHPSTDMFGTSRPAGGAPDAGAVELS